MKIYISLPMGGHEKTVRQRYEEAVKRIKDNSPENTVISGPLNIEDFDDNGYNCPTENLNEIGRDHPWEYYIGEDIKELLTCDAIYMTRGFNNSNGCKIEQAVMTVMKKRIYYAADAYDSL